MQSGGLQSQRPTFNSDQTEMLGRKISSTSAADHRACAVFGDKSYATAEDATAVAIVYDDDYKGLGEMLKHYQACPSWLVSSTNIQEDWKRARELSTVYSLRWSKKVHSAFMAMCRDFIDSNNLEMPSTVEGVLRQRRRGAKKAKKLLLQKRLSAMDNSADEDDDRRRQVDAESVDTTDSDEDMKDTMKCKCGKDLAACGACGQGWSQRKTSDNASESRASSSSAKGRRNDDMDVMKSSVIGLQVKVQGQANGDGQPGQSIGGTIEDVNKVADGWKFVCKMEDQTERSLNLEEIKQVLMIPERLIERKLTPFRTVSIATPPVAKTKRAGIQGIRIPKMTLPERND